MTATINRSDYRVTVVIDRLAVEFAVSSATQARHVHKRLGGSASFVEGLDATGTPFDGFKTNTTTTRFRATLQDPTSAKAVLTAIRACGPTAPPTLVMLEPALDVYIKGASKQALGYVVADLYRFFEAQPASHWHIYREKGERARLIDSDPELNRRALANELADRWQLADTDKKEVPMRRHAYVKSFDYDAASGKVTDLPADQCPDGHFKFLHLWPVKFLQAGQVNYQSFCPPGAGPLCL